MPATPDLAALSTTEGQRYSRHLVLPEVGRDGQRKLKVSSVLVVGLGGLGTPAAVYLASAGVGRLGLVDQDTVDLPNLQRQFLFSEADIGEKKVEVAAARLRTVNPYVKLDVWGDKLDSSNALDIIRGYDLVIDATDNLPSRYLINDACVMLGKPDVYASVLGFDGQASVFWATRGPCYRCLYPTPPPPESVQSCEDAGVLGMLPGVMGSLQAVQ
ncbi:MAG: HesA/MoeB/ThiF family protein, partial [Thaumarchaeota archaeon]|nr:HesA/MoeB/ThiF family protein [Nitrososphaerota archaeon]